MIRKNLKIRKIEIVIAGAGERTPTRNDSCFDYYSCTGVPVESKSLKGIDSLLSIVQMPAGIPLPTLAIGKAGAKNAALASISILANKYPLINKKLELFRKKQPTSINKLPNNEKYSTGDYWGWPTWNVYVYSRQKKKTSKVLFYQKRKSLAQKISATNISFQILKT